MKTTTAPTLPSLLSPARWLPLVAGLALGLTAQAATAATTLISDHDAYYPEEDILLSFASGPGQPKDWVGLYPIDATPGPTPSTRWFYVDGTQGGATGYKEGTLTFGGGLTLAGDWAAYFLLNDGYTIAATNLFKIVDPGTPLVRLGARIVATGGPITLTFTNGPAGAKDWVGIYKSGQTPGGPVSTLWNYVDGTHAGNTGKADGTMSFPTGLSEAGDYVAYFFDNDSYNILASERFTVAAPSGAGPRLLTLSPADGSSNQPPLLRFSATVTNGAAPVAASGVVLKYDGAVVPAPVVQANGVITVLYTDPSLPAPGSPHTWTLTVQDTATPANTLTSEARFTVADYRNVVLPTPLYFENFDGTAEGALPAGWTGKSYTDIQNQDEDLGNLDSATYARWTVVNADRFKGSFVTYSNPDNPADWGTDYQRVMAANPFNVLNGQVINTPLAQGRFLFADSGYRNGRSQVLYVSTPDYNLTGKTNVHLAFKSLWEQNQDSIALVEYSVDQGAHWLPVAYFLDRNDIYTKTNEVTGAVSMDVEATLSTEHGDVAIFTDDTGSDVGGTYGAFLGAPISDALAPYIQGRIDDDRTGSKRIEYFALPQADNQSKVRVRFGHAGTDSWYFGIDDVGLYSIGSAPTTGATLSVQRDGAQIVVSWPASATGAGLRPELVSSTATWTTVPGVTGTSHRVSPSATPAFFRLRQ